MNLDHLKHELGVSIRSSFNYYEQQNRGFKLKSTNLLDEIADVVNEELVRMVLRRNHGNQVHSATILGINRNTLRKLISKYSINVDLMKEPKDA